jgi:cell division septation protein DedD
MTGRANVQSGTLPSDGGGDQRRWLGWIKAGLVLLLIGGFGAAVAHVYYQMTRDGGLIEGTIPVVRADPQPFRVRPANPGGLDVPHQNLEVFNRLTQTQAPAPTQGRGAAATERLVPPPEAPVQRPVAPPRPNPAAQPPAGQRPPAQHAQQPPQPPAAQQAQRPGQQVAAAPAAPAGAVSIQLAALPTEERANQELERIRRSGREVLGGTSLRVVRAQSAAGAAVFRVVGGPVRDRAAAVSLCERLRERRVNCVITR